MSEKMERLMDKLLHAAYQVLRDEYRGSEPDVWVLRIGDPTGTSSPNELAGTYRHERAAIVAMTRELDKRWPNAWEVNGGYQFTMKTSTVGNYVLAVIDSRHSNGAKVEYTDAS